MNRDEWQPPLKVEPSADLPTPRVQRRRAPRERGATETSPSPAVDLFEGAHTQLVHTIDLRYLTREPELRLACDRTHLANVRTFLSWLRTALALEAVGLVVAYLAPRSTPHASLSLALSVTLVLLGVAIAVFGMREYGRTATALERHSGRAPPVTPGWARVLTALAEAPVGAALFLLWSR
jgi:putative membrane protein